MKTAGPRQTVSAPVRALPASEHRARAGWAAGLALLMAACGSEHAPSQDTASAETFSPPFEDVAAATGLVFEHNSGASGNFYMPEIMGGGIALFDYDGDGDLDVLLAQGRSLDENAQTAGAGPLHQLFRNEITPTGSLRFTNVSARSGINDRNYGMGIAVGDVDNDGDQDVYLANYGENAFYLNNGDGTFSNATAASATGDSRFGSSAAFTDYDADGLLDLFVVNYNTFSVSNNRVCRGAGRSQDYCDPLSYEPAVDRIFRNAGAARFEDAGQKSGIDQHFGTGLGVIAADFDLNGTTDIYVANDKMANICWFNDGNGKFHNDSLMSGTAYNADGKAEASMGVVAGDIDGDGDDDLFMTHLTSQTNTLYLNDGSGSFRDATDQLNLGASSLPYTGFGTVLIDFDNDGDEDILIANGAVQRDASASGNRLAEYGQRNQLYRNDGSGRFTELSDKAGPPFSRAWISRGAAVGDIDNDGDLDAVVSNIDGPLELLLNRGDADNHWLRVSLRGISANRDGAGARVALVRPSGQQLWRRAHTDGSYLSASDIRVHFGLGKDPELAGVGVVWPNGTREFWTGIKANTQVVLDEGSGQAWPD